MNRFTAERTGHSSDRGGIIGALLILLLTTALSLVWSSAKLMGNDEFLSFYSDSVPAAQAVLQVQLHTPISLDPPTYHLLSHLSMELVGRSATALRLPTMFGFMLLQGSLFLLVRRLAGYRAALVAMVLPLCTASFRYSVEGRPYGLLLGLYAVALLCWYFATQRREEGRLLALLLLVASIALAITSHYFGVLVLVPLAAGEVARTMQRRRLDWPVVTALSAGLASIVIVLPFKKALAPYQQHYYTNSVNLRNVSQGYRELFVHYNAWPAVAQKGVALLLAIAFVALCYAALRRFRDRPETEPAFLWAALLALVLLPFFGYLFGKFVTHTMEVRYVIAALIAFAIAIALLLQRTLRSTGAFAGILGLLLLAAVGLTSGQIRAERAATAQLLASLRVPSALHDELVQEPSRRVYVQTLDDFFRDSYYASDPLFRERVSMIYDGDAEVRWLRHNTNAVTAEYMQAFTPLDMASYNTMQTGDRPALLLTYGGSWEWIRHDLAERGTPMQPLGNALGGELWSIGAGARR